MNPQFYEDFEELPDVAAFAAWRRRYEALYDETEGGWHTVCEPPVFSVCKVGAMADPDSWLAFVEDAYPGETKGRHSKCRYYVRKEAIR